jgi:hypothetical protein
MMSQPDGWAFYGIAAAAVGVTFLVICRNRISFSRLAIVLGLFAAACSGRRNIPLFALAAVPFIAELLAHRFERIVIHEKQKIVAALFLLSFSLLPLSGFYYSHFNYNPIRFGLGAPSEFQPSGLPEILRSTGFNGQIYNNDLFGGYLMYHGIRPLFDGRWEIYDLDELTALLNAPFDPVVWHGVESRYHITGVLLRLGEPGTQAFVLRFLGDGSYRQIYADRVSSFWVKNVR